MDDTNVFERLVADEMERRAGPDPVVDDAAIFTAITATQSPKWRFQSVFSATKFVVAGVIVALFGGFLLAGVLTQPSGESLPAARSSATAPAEPTVEPTAESEPGPESDEVEQADSTAREALPAGMFSPVRSLAGAPIGTATRLRDGRVLVVGGTRAEVWDPTTESSSPAGEMVEPRSGHGAALLPDGRALVVGGYGPDGQDLFQAEVWDPATESFSPVGALIETRSGSTSSTTLLPDGRVFVVGGGVDHRVGASALAEVWDPETTTFSSAGEMARARVSQTATVLPDGRVLVIGGMVPNNLKKSATSAEIWDPETTTFSFTGSLLEGRDGHTATRLLDGRVLVIGGDLGRNDHTWSAEIWDPVTASFSPAGPLLEERYKHTATLLPDGRVLVIGGMGGTGGDPSTAEVWDPATKSFSPAGSLTDVRSVGTATLLLDGRVLVTGDGSAEVWEPINRSSGADDDTTTPDLLPGVDLVTEEVEPGVYRVLSDGAGHDLVAEPPAGVTIAPDGSVWLLRRGAYEVGTAGEAHRVDGVYRLGQPATPAVQSIEPSSTNHTDLAVDVDGRAWVSIGSEPLQGGWGWSVAQGTLASHDGAKWTTPTWPDGSGDVGAIETSADGSVWVARIVQDGSGPSVARIKDGSWTALPPLDDPTLEGHFASTHSSFAVAADGTAWLGANGRVTSGEAPGPTGLLHFDGERWEVVDLPVEGEVTAGPLALGPDGTLWVYARGIGADFSEQNYLLRLDADGWTVYSGRSSGASGHTLDEADGVPLLSTPIYYEARMAVDPDGKLWIAVGGDGGLDEDGPNWLYPPSLDPAPGPVGLLTFDGTTWNQYLKGLHVNRVDIADDGTVYATALYGCSVDLECDPYAFESLAGWDLGGLYVITPEAVAAVGLQPTPCADEVGTDNVAAAHGACWVPVSDGVDRHIDGASELVEPAAIGLAEGQSVNAAAADEDGTLWLTVHDDARRFAGLVGHDGQTWTRVPYEPEAGSAVGEDNSALAVAPDGTFWVQRTPPFATNSRVNAVTFTTWDGDTWTSYGPVEHDFGHGGWDRNPTFRPDGTIWFYDGQIVFDGETVITPEAVAATE